VILDADLAGCFFHWKQAVRKKLLGFNIPKHIVSEPMAEDGLMELLTIIDINEIVSKGTPYIRANCVHEVDYKDKFDLFWRYFVSTWLQRYDPQTWNIHHILGRERPISIVNRTNNALERYNRELNE
jgi:hypothetical protein